MALKNNILSLIENENISVSALARKSGIKIPTLQNIIYGRVENPTINVLKALSTALNCSLLDLVDEDHSIFFENNWNPELFYDCLEVVGKKLKSKNKELTYENSITIIRELYKYSLKENKSKVSKEMLHILTQDT
jgi:transcriptional regulator with XRE-family HTH domain